MSHLLRGERLTLVRGGRLLFEGLELTLGSGDALHVMGMNGSGKSSLLRLAAGLLQPTAGRLERSGAALCDEALALDRELPLERALTFWGGVGVGKAMEAFGLAALARVPVRLLSTGQAKRAALARVLASAAPLWLLDEPLNGLDSDGKARLGQAIAAHRRAGGGVLAASHLPLDGAWRELTL